MRLALPAIITILGLAGPASALSCMAPDIVRSFERFEASDHFYLLVSGQISTSARVGSSEEPGEGQVVAGTFKGFSFTQQAFDAPLSGKILVETSCVGPWCGSLPDDATRVYFVELKPDGSLHLDMPACGGTAFDPAAAIELEKHLTIDAASTSSDGLPFLDE